MESSTLANLHGHRLYMSLPLSNANNPVKVSNFGFKLDRRSDAFSSSSCLVHRRKNDDGFGLGCASWSLGSELERELEAEMKTETEHREERQGSIGMGRYRHKCGERRGVVELLECLEREAIMGEDVGKEPMDYNRRAQIFDRSARVFQALKESNTHVVSQS